MREAFVLLGSAVDALARATREGTSRVFGHLGGAPLPFVELRPGASFVLFPGALPLVLVMRALSAAPCHWRVLPAVVRRLPRGLRRVFGLSGACGFPVAANVFVGMVKAPLLIRAWLAALSTPALFTATMAGLATLSGNMPVIHATVISAVVPDAAGPTGLAVRQVAGWAMWPPALAMDAPTEQAGTVAA